jgi:transcriptional antiterminator NusG
MKTKIFAVKAQVGQELNVSNSIYNRAKKDGKIFAILTPREIRGYVFIEGNDLDYIKKLVKPLRYAREVLEGDIPIEETENFLFPPSSIAKISEGDILEIVSGPFKGEKAKVIRMDDSKEEVTVEIIDAMVPIPITVRGEHVRILKKGG